MSDLFISYESKSLELVFKIANSLQDLYKFKVWIDKKDLKPGMVLHENIQDGITNSEAVLAFVTKHYCESVNCQLEVTYSNRIKKKILYMMLEKLDPTKLPKGMGMFITQLFCFNAYSESWSSETTEKLVKSIQNLLNEKPL